MEEGKNGRKEGPFDCFVGKEEKEEELTPNPSKTFFKGVDV